MRKAKQAHQTGRYGARVWKLAKGALSATPLLTGRKEGPLFIAEIRCRDAEQFKRIVERIQMEVLG